jgi:hypothetical protein
MPPPLAGPASDHGQFPPITRSETKQHPGLVLSRRAPGSSRWPFGGLYSSHISSLLAALSLLDSSVLAVQAVCTQRDSHVVQAYRLVAGARASSVAPSCHT